MDSGPAQPISPSMIAPGAVIAGKYRVERVLGEGGMGIVIAAYHQALDQKVALKLLRGASLDRPDVTARFLREARNAVRLRSLHAARVFDVGTLDNGWPYIVMEHLESADLDQVVRRDGAIAHARAVGLILQACEAVAEAHALGIVHRDLKPHNLFLTTGFGGSDLVKVLDFGIAKSNAVQAVLTKTDSSVGSPLYMSPEQMRTPRDVDSRTDIWSLGVTLYEILAGCPPFDAESFPELVLKVTEGRVVPLASVRPDIPRGISAIIERCLKIDPNDRFADVAELATALEPFAAPDSRVAAENARRALGRAPSSPVIPANAPVDSRVTTGENAPGSKPSGRIVSAMTPPTVNEAHVDTVRAPDTMVSATGNPVVAAASVANKPLTASGGSNPQGWAGALTVSATSIPGVAPKRPKIAAFVLGIGLMLAIGAFAYVRMTPKDAGNAASAGVGASASGLAVGVQNPPASASNLANPPATAASATSIASAAPATSASAKTASPPIGSSANARGKRPGANPAGSAASSAPAAAPPKPTDEIPSER